MSKVFPRWLTSRQGIPPKVRWSFSTEAALAAVALARESGHCLAADVAGGLYRLDRTGTLAALTRAWSRLQLLASDDVGRRCAAIVDENRLMFLESALRVLWSVELPEAATALAVEGHGQLLAVALANGKNVVYDAHRHRAAVFETDNVLRQVVFLSTQPAVIGVSEFGFLGRWNGAGEEVWSAGLQLNVGDLACTGGGERILLAGFSHGVRRLGGNGERLGTFLLEGTPNHLSTSFFPHRIAATTLEGHLYWLDDEGEILWGAELDEEAAAVCVQPLGEGLICGVESGRLISLSWEPTV